MKRLLLSLTLALFAFSGSVNAQETRFNEEALMKKLTKLEADSKDAKKGAKAATWLELGKVYENAATGLTNGLYVGLDSMTTELVFPKPERGVETINGVTYLSGKRRRFVLVRQESRRRGRAGESCRCLQQGL